MTPATSLGLCNSQLECNVAEVVSDVQVPLLWTVYALVSFREFRIMSEDHAARRCA